MKKIPYTPDYNVQDIKKMIFSTWVEVKGAEARTIQKREKVM